MVPRGGTLSNRLQKVPGRGTFPAVLGSRLPPIPPWTHDRLLLSLERTEARARSFYEIAAANDKWSLLSVVHPTSHRHF